jgi:hypothetical protein
MQWELDLSSGQPGRCVADFTLDDIKLVSKL